MPYREGDDARRVHLRLVESLTIPTPCRESWNRMQGDERVRHCSRCSKDVHNLSALSLEEIAALVERLQGKLCARFYRRPDGSLVTGYCPSTDTARLASRIAGATAAALGVATAAALIASAPKPPPTSSETEFVGILVAEDEYISAAVLDPDDPSSFEEVMGDAIDLRAVVVDRLVTSGATDETIQHRRFPTREELCSRINPAGSFDDAEIEAGAIAAPDAFPLGTFGWGAKHDPRWMPAPCPIKRDDEFDD